MTSRDDVVFDVLRKAIDRAHQLPPDGYKSPELLTLVAVKFAEISYLHEEIVPLLRDISESLKSFSRATDDGRR